MVLLGALHFPESPENSSLVEDSLLQQVAEGNQEAWEDMITADPWEGMHR